MFFLYISLPTLHEYDAKMPIFTFCGGREHNTTTFFFFSWTPVHGPLEFSPGKTANNWRIEGEGISATKFEAVQRYLLTDVFVAVAVVVA